MWSPLCIAVRNFEGCLKRMGLKYTITLFRLNWQITELPSCLLDLPDECEVRFALQWGTSKAVWKEWVSHTILHFSDWISIFLIFLLAFWIYQMNVKSALHCSEELRRLSEKNGSQIHDNTFHTEFADFWDSFLPFIITRWMWSPLCIAVRNFEDWVSKNGSLIHYFTFQTELADFWGFFLPFGNTRWCEVHFTVQWGV